MEAAEQSRGDDLSTTSPRLDRKRVAVAGVTVALTGSFNPRIFQPEWFKREGLLFGDFEDDAAQAEDTLVYRTLTRWRTDSMTLEVTPDEFRASTLDESFEPSLRELLIRTFELLKHTPVGRVSIERWVHYWLGSSYEQSDIDGNSQPPPVEANDIECPKQPLSDDASEAELDARKEAELDAREEVVLTPEVRTALDALVPPKPWAEMLRSPYIDTARFVGDWSLDPEVSLSIEVEPSRMVPGALFVGFSQSSWTESAHHGLPDATEVTSTLKDDWASARELAFDTISRVLHSVGAPLE